MKTNRGTEFRALVAVSIKVEEEFKGIIGVLFKDENGNKDDDAEYLKEISKNITVALRQRMLFSKLEEANRKLKDSFRSFIALIEKIIELKDPSGKVHGDNITEVTFETAKRMGLEEKRIEYLTYAAVIYGVG
jgi:HD-GYP domain-containing protein (c-di-GMP phosphodiesterase class II)